MKPGAYVQHASAAIWLALVTFIAIAAAEPARAQQHSTSDSITSDSLLHLSVRDIGPPVGGGRVSAVVGVPGRPDIYYIGAAAGGVWKTTNAGNSWTPIFEHEPVASIGAIALAPSNPNLVWVGTGEANIRNDIINGRGVYYSPDAGRSWKFVGLSNAGQIAKVVIDPQNPQHVLVAALGQAWTPNAERGVFVTTDGGKTWRKTLFVNDSTGAADLAMEPGNSMVLLAATWQVQRLPWELIDGGPGSAIYKSTDGGETWTKLANGLPTGALGRIALGVSPSVPEHVYALIEGKQGLLWESHDFGEHWAKVSGNHALDVRPFYFSKVNVDPTDDQHVFFSSYQLMESHDGGRTAKEIDGNDVHPDHHSLWIDPQNPRRMIQGNDGGVWVTADGGHTWRFLNNLPIGQFYMVAADNNTPYNLCGGLQDNNAWCGPSNTLSFGGQNGADWFTVTGGDGEYAVPAPSDSDIIYTDSQNGFITRLDRKTGLSRFIRPYLSGVSDKSPADLKYRFNWTSPIAVHPTNANEVFLGGNVVFKSTDGGQHWQTISPDLTRNDKSKQHTSGGPIEHDISGAETYNTILTITLAPSDTNTIWAGTDDGLVWVTRDAGKSWQNVTPKAFVGEGRVYQVGISPADPGTAYVTLDRHEFSDMKPYVFKTTDYGRSWTEIDKGLPADQPAHVVREDPNRRGLLVLGTDAGLWYSHDAGATWKPLTGTFPTAPVYDLQFVARTRDLLVATHGRGLFILDDIAPLEELSPAVLASDLHIFQPLAATMWFSSRGEGPSASAYVVPNPPRGAALDYFLQRAPKDTGARAGANANAGNAGASGGAGEEVAGGAGGPPAPGDSAGGGIKAAVVVTASNGDTITVDTATAKPGINRYVWNLRYRGPTRLAIAERPQGGFGAGFRNSGPAVLPGTYSLAITVNGRTQRTNVTVLPDPRVPFDTAAAQAQLETGLALRDEISALNTMLNRIHSMRDQIRGVQQVVRNTPGATADGSVLKSARQLDQHLKALADSVYNSDVQRGAPEDDIHYLTRFHDQLQSMGFAVLFPYDQAPSEVVQEQMTGMRQELDRYLEQFNALVQRDVAAYNQAAAKANLPVVVPGGTVEVGKLEL